MKANRSNVLTISLNRSLFWLRLWIPKWCICCKNSWKPEEEFIRPNQLQQRHRQVSKIESYCKFLHLWIPLNPILKNMIVHVVVSRKQGRLTILKFSPYQFTRFLSLHLIEKYQICTLSRACPSKTAIMDLPIPAKSAFFTISLRTLATSSSLNPASRSPFCMSIKSSSHFFHKSWI